jgi:hypothetical protein
MVVSLKRVSILAAARKGEIASLKAELKGLLDAFL